MFINSCFASDNITSDNITSNNATDYSFMNNMNFYDNAYDNIETYHENDQKNSESILNSLDSHVKNLSLSGSSHSNQSHSNQSHSNQSRSEQLYNNQSRNNQRYSGQSYRNELRSNELRSNGAHNNIISNQPHRDQSHSNQSRSNQLRSDQLQNRNIQNNQSFNTAYFNILMFNNVIDSKTDQFIYNKVENNFRIIEQMWPIVQNNTFQTKQNDENLKIAKNEILDLKKSLRKLELKFNDFSFNNAKQNNVSENLTIRNLKERIDILDKKIDDNWTSMQDSVKSLMRDNIMLKEMINQCLPRIFTLEGKLQNNNI